jgi:hypothetical protein
MKMYGGVVAWIHVSMTMSGYEWLASRPSQFTLGKMASGTHYTWDWVVLIADLDYVKRKFLPLLRLKI